LKNSQALEFAQLLLNGDEHAAVQLVKAHSHLTRMELFEEIITPAM
jgi:hypothetical protein